MKKPGLFAKVLIRVVWVLIFIALLIAFCLFIRLIILKA
jgi:hypothetical protein